VKIARAVAPAFALAACTPARPVASSAAAHDVPRAANDTLLPLPPGPASAVVTLEHEVPTAIVRGPFMVTSINPGSDLYLALAARTCGDPGLVWFGYSGGGVGVSAGQILCARSVRGAPHPQAFSGRSEAEITSRPGGP
jgi:hypothetical protein